MNPIPRALLAAAALAGFFALPSAANATVNAFATGNVNMRTCGSTRCARIATVPVGAPVIVYTCTPGYSWCDTQFGGYRGWVSGRYLQATAPGYTSPSPMPAIGALLGLGIAAAVVANNDYYYYPQPRYRYPRYRYPRYRNPRYRHPGYRPPYRGRVSPGWRGGGYGRGGGGYGHGGYAR